MTKTDAQELADDVNKQAILYFINGANDEYSYSQLIHLMQEKIKNVDDLLRELIKDSFINVDSSTTIVYLTDSGKKIANDSSLGIGAYRRFNIKEKILVETTQKEKMFNEAELVKRNLENYVSEKRKYRTTLIFSLIASVLSLSAFCWSIYNPYKTDKRVDQLERRIDSLHLIISSKK